MTRSRGPTRSEFERRIREADVVDVGPFRAIELPAELVGIVVGAHARHTPDGRVLAGWWLDELLELAAQTLRDEQSGLPSIRRRTALFRRLLGADWATAEALAALPRPAEPTPAEILELVGQADS